MTDNITIGAPYRFVPAELMAERGASGRYESIQVTGHIRYINRAHRFFRVAYEINGYELRECIKF